MYDPKLPIKLDSDASKFGLGAVLSHVYPDGSEKVIEYASRTLNKAERNYSQIEKEALSLVWSIKRFHRYLFARPFTLVTDHKPLEFILHPQKGIPQMGVSRIIRWALFLSSYQYTINFRPTQRHSNADMCSRFPLESQKGVCEKSDDSIDGSVYSIVSESEIRESIFSIHYLGDDMPLLDSVSIAKHTKRDPLLSRVLYQVTEGWSEVLGQKRDTVGCKDELIKPYFERRSQLSVDMGCVLWGSRVCIPSKLQAEILRLLHSTHMGMVSMKALARSFVWWPGLDGSIESVVRQCTVCQLNQSKPAKAVPHPWVKATKPWERIHLDFCGPIFGSMWMVVIDSYSKWIEIVRMTSTRSSAVIQKLKQLFSRWGLPVVLVSDNGPQLKSEEMEKFTKNNGINHIFIPAYHPASNGQVESICGKFKRAMKRMQMTKQDLMGNLASWLLLYRNTVHPATGREPSVAMLGYRTRCAFSLLHPLSNPRQSAKSTQQEQKSINQETETRQFERGEAVMYWNEHHKRWYRGVVAELQGSRVVVDGEHGRERKHVDHITKTATTEQDKVPVSQLSESRKEVVPSVEEKSCVNKPLELPAAEVKTPELTLSTVKDNAPVLPTRSSTRQTRPPERLTYKTLGNNS